MLKLFFSSSCPQKRIHSLAPTSIRTDSAGSTAPFLCVFSTLTSFTGQNPSLGCRAFFCSDASGGSEPVAETEVKEAESEAEAKPSSSTVSTDPIPEDYLKVG